MNYQPMKTLRTWLVLLMALMMTACGGGGGSPGTTSGTTPGSGAAPVATASVTVSLVNASGQPANSVSAAAPLTAKALIKDASGALVANALVTFAADNTLAVLAPSSGATLSDANGVASVTLRPASLAANGAGKVTASAIIAGATVVGEANYAIGVTALTFGTLTLAPNHIAAYGSTEVSVDVLAGGVKYANQLNVTFTSACVTAGKATIAASVPTQNGIARTTYRDQGCATNDVISASADGVATSATAALTIDVPTAASIQFFAATPIDKSIVIKGQGGIGRSETAILTFKVFDTFNNPLANQPVAFSTSAPDVTINKVTDNTDASGAVITTVNSGAKPTTFRVKATLGNGVSTLSDSIVVTTGLPVQQGFSLSVSKANIEGWSFDSGTLDPASNVNVLLADQFGNPVTDGTPVVFQTNLGAIGSSSKGACNTANGGCSVDFRSQNPRVAARNTPATPCNTLAGASNDSTRAGLATICASTTDGINTIFSKIGIFFSGSVASNVFLDDQSTRLSGSTDLGQVGAHDPKVFSLQINDLNFNPMPVGTIVSVDSLVNATLVGVAPASVPNIFPHSSAGDDATGNNISGNQGSVHVFTIGSTQPTLCLGPLSGTFNVTVTTARGQATSYPFKLTFTCP